MAATEYSVYRVQITLENQAGGIPAGALLFVGGVTARTPKDAVEETARETGTYVAIPTRYVKRIPATVRTQTVVEVTVS